MSIITDFTVPAAEFILAHSSAAVPDVRVEVERVVLESIGQMTPYFWTSGGDLDAFEAALADDPTIRDVAVLETHDDKRFYRADWDHDDRGIVYAVSDAEATIMEAVGEHGQWELRLLFPDEAALSAFQDHCREHGLSFELVRIFKTEHPRAFGKYDVTTEQREALVAAYEAGYFEVPRGATLAEVADRLGISQQAASARLRRGYANLVANAFVATTDE